jgi:hypothetical protein
MTASEKVAYIRGLVEGLGIYTSEKEGKVLSAIIDVLDDLALSIDEVEDNIDELTEELDAVSEDLADVEEVVFDEFEDEDDDEDEDDEYDDDDEEYEYAVECPACHQEFTVDEETLDSNIIKCPLCGETLELEFEDEDEEPSED